MTKFTHAELVEMLNYNPETGLFEWRIKKAQIISPGRTAGCLNNFGYMRIGINGKSYMAHKLAWFYCYGVWPTTMIDHINRNRADNRICNLREATRSQNTLNTEKHRNHTSGVRGVDWVKSYGKWMARIQIDGKRKTIGFFDDLEEAIKARKDAEQNISLGNTTT